MSDLDEVWNMSNVTNTNRTTIKNNSLANSSFPRNKLGPSYAPYTQEEVSGVGNEETTQLGYRYVNPDNLVYDQTNNIGYPLQSGCNPMVHYQPKNVYSTTLGMSPAVITPEYLNTLFSNEYFLKLLGEFMIANNMNTTKESFTLKSIDTGIFDLIFKIIVILMMIVILFKVK